jgi:hypothetical protein
MVGTRRTRARIALGSTLTLLILLATAVSAAPGSAAERESDGRSHVARATVTGPVTGGKGSPSIADNLSQLPAFNYVQQEYFIEGDTHAYGMVGTWTTNGQWTATPSTSAHYKTRLLVRRPVDPSKFNGTVVVEWLNVSAGFDAGPDWGYARTELLRGGYAWIGVSAQAAGIDGPAGIAGLAPLKKSDPVRYASLVHPGDSYSYDIYSQAGEAVRHPDGANLLAGLHPRKLLAAGESQSAFRLVTYINAVDPLARVYDGFFVHSRFQLGSPIFNGRGGDVPSPSRIRTDLRVPVLVFESETDVRLEWRARQPDNRRFRQWEVAGTAHADSYLVPAAALPLLGCTVQINDGPEHWIVHTAIATLRRWVTDDDFRPPHSPRIVVDGNGTIVRDQFGNARGGIRTPQLDVPIATLSGQNNDGGFCSLFGQTTPFSATALASLYPTHGVYVEKFERATDRAQDRGFLLPVDAREIEAAARTAPIPH